MKWWLIRYEDQSFSRPIEEVDLLGRIESGLLGRKDEICPSGGYWFQIQDVAEVRKFLGQIDLGGVLKSESQTATTLPGSAKTRANIGMEPVEELPKPSVKLKLIPKKGSVGSPVSANFQFNPDTSVELAPEESEASVWGQIISFILVGFIFLGTVYFLWTNSMK